MTLNELRNLFPYCKIDNNKTILYEQKTIQIPIYFVFVSILSRLTYLPFIASQIAFMRIINAMKNWELKELPEQEKRQIQPWSLVDKEKN